MGKVKVPTLETDRLLLRMWHRRDAAELFAYARNPNVGPNAGWKPHSSVSESRTIITQMFHAHRTWAITLKETGQIIGSIGFEQDYLRPTVESLEMGYSMSEDHWGNGYMTEAARRLIRFGFEELGLRVLSIRTRENNHRSQRVIAKCGFKYEGTLRRAYRTYDGKVRETRVYSMLREEYEEIYLGALPEEELAAE